MRIIGGTKKGAIIRAPKSLPVRPTMDRNKESLFNILNNYFWFDEMQVLDLFSGTGNISFEFASRGAQRVVAVDAHAGCVKFISKKANELDFPQLEVVKADVWRYLQQEGQQYDFIYADPPFTLFKPEQYGELASLIFEAELLKPGGWLVMEHPSSVDISQHPHLDEERSFGQCIMAFFRNGEE